MEQANGKKVEAKDWVMNGNTETQRNGVQHHDGGSKNGAHHKDKEKPLDIVSSTSTAFMFSLIFSQ